MTVHWITGSVHKNCKLRTCSEHVEYVHKFVLNVKTKINLCTQHVVWSCSELVIFMYWTRNSMNNLSSYYGLVDAKIRASDKDLPVQVVEKVPKCLNICYKLIMEKLLVLNLEELLVYLWLNVWAMKHSTNMALR